MTASCADFDAAVDELAVGSVGEPARSDLLAHAASCPSCAVPLRELVAVVDRLLLLAPPAEPPPGFETKVLAALRARHRRWPLVVGAAAAVLALVVGALLVVARPGEATRRSAPIVGAGGRVVGDVVIVAEPRPHVLVSVEDPRPGPGVRSCELVLPDGERVVVGSWGYEEIDTGVWAVAVDARVLDAVSMRITDGDRVVATGRFD